MAKNTESKSKRSPLPKSIDEGKALAQKYYDRMPALAAEEGGKETPGGYKNYEEFLWTYLVPMGLNRLAALDRYRESHPKPAKPARKSKKAA